MFYSFAKGLVRFISFFIFRIKVNGKENIPPDGGAIFAVNHRSLWDPVLVAVTSSRRLAFMAKSELFKNKLFAFLIKSLGAFPVQRGKGDIGAVKTSLTILNNKQAMMIFPEGKRVAKNERVEAKPGVAMLATHSRVPVIPVCITGGYRWLSKISVSYGNPIYFDEYYGEKLSVEQLQSLSRDIMNTIYKLGGIN